MRRFFSTLAAAWRIGAAWLHDADSLQRQIIKECLRLGGVYIKFLQMLAIHHSTKQLVGAVNNRLVFEEVPFEPIDIDAELRRSGHHRTAFARIEQEPFAAGSYGQVYKAWLQDGTAVIIKVLRPSVRASIAIDLKVLGGVAFVLQFVATRSFVNVRKTYQEFARVTRRETNYELEAESGEWLRDYFSTNGQLYIPRSYIELGSRTILVQEYVGGISLAEAMERQEAGERIDELVHDATGSNIWDQLHVLGRDFLGATLRADYLMADPHPGNIRLLADNKVALIDFGLIAPAPTNRTAFANLIGEFLRLYKGDFQPGAFALAMLAFYDTELYTAFSQVASQEHYDYGENLGRLIQQRISKFSQDVRLQYYVNDRQVTKLFTEVLNDNNSLGIILDESNIVLQRSMGVYLSVIRAIGERHGSSVHFRITEAILADVHQFSIEHGFFEPPQMHMSTEAAYEVVANWLCVVAERDRVMYNQLFQRSFA